MTSEKAPCNTWSSEDHHRRSKPNLHICQMCLQEEDLVAIKILEWVRFATDTVCEHPAFCTPLYPTCALYVNPWFTFLLEYPSLFPHPTPSFTVLPRPAKGCLDLPQTMPWPASYPHCAIGRHHLALCREVGKVVCSKGLWQGHSFRRHMTGITC